MNIRVRAIICDEGKVLLIHRCKSNREYWVFPGGGVESSDKNDLEALHRECREELGVDIRIGREFHQEIGKTRETFYLCLIIGGELGSGNGQEYSSDSGYSGTYTLEWVAIAELKNKEVFPKEVRDKVLKEVVD